MSDIQYTVDNTPPLNFELTVNSEQQRKAAHKMVDDMFDFYKYVRLDFTAGQAVTDPQFKALHVWCGMVAEALNEHGLDKQRVLDKKSLAVPWTKDGVKEDLYKPALAALSGKDSTKDQDRVEPTAVQDVLCNFFANNFGVTLPPWPEKKDKAA